MDIKIYNKSGTKRHALQPGMNWAEFHKNFLEEKRATYLDDEREWILLENNEDFVECVRVWSDKIKPLSLKIKVHEAEEKQQIESESDLEYEKVDAPIIETEIEQQQQQQAPSNTQDPLHTIYSFGRNLKEYSNYVFQEIKQLNIPTKVNSFIADIKKNPPDINSLFNYCYEEIKKKTSNDKSSTEIFGSICGFFKGVEKSLKDTYNTLSEKFDRLTSNNYPIQKQLTENNADKSVDNKSVELLDEEKNKLSLLKDMGFGDDSKNTSVLRKHNHDLQKTIGELLF